MSEETCKTCNGHGKTPTINDIYMVCFECKGLGTIAKTEYQIGDTVPLMVPSKFHLENPPQPPRILKALIERIEMLERGNFPESAWNQGLRERIEKLETQVSRCVYYINENDERIGSIEGDMNYVPSFEALNDLDNNLYKLIREIQERIEKVEKRSECNWDETQECGRHIGYAADSQRNSIKRIEKIEEKLNMLDYTKAGLDNIKTLVEISKEQKIFNANVNNILEILLERLNAKS